MRSLVDFLKLLDTHFAVNLRGLKLLVTEQLLDEADVRSVFQYQCCHTVAEDVTASGQPDDSYGYTKKKRFTVLHMTLTIANP